MDVRFVKDDYRHVDGILLCQIESLSVRFSPARIIATAHAARCILV
jgi:hypothetical protein